MKRIQGDTVVLLLLLLSIPYMHTCSICAYIHKHIHTPVNVTSFCGFALFHDCNRESTFFKGPTIYFVIFSNTRLSISVQTLLRVFIFLTPSHAFILCISKCLLACSLKKFFVLYCLTAGGRRYLYLSLAMYAP